MRLRLVPHCSCCFLSVVDFFLLRYFLELVESLMHTQQPKTGNGMESLTKKKISEEVETIRLEKIDDFRYNLQSRQIYLKLRESQFAFTLDAPTCKTDRRDGDKRVFHVKIVNTVISIDSINDGVMSKAHPRNLADGNSLDTKSGDPRDFLHSRSSTFQVTGSLTYVCNCLDHI